ncbi:EAL domain-containing protein [Nitrincola sp. A-D6]|uniref:EAL domain-containing protein n=1 Tax=Nitrincola sp. A-D6 TaxID=1545442 RepID=UPI000690CE54|nr:EAL domain-containing protein [Nitrincola sp. A-D6]
MPEKQADEVAEKTLTFLVSWLVSHILESDHYLASVVKGKLQGLTTDEAFAAAKSSMQDASDVLIDIIRSIYTAHSRNTLRLGREVSDQRQAVADALQAKSEALAISHQRLLNILDGTHAAVYVADMHSYEVLFINAYARQLLGDVAGRICWQAIQGRSAPCDFCTNDRLLRADGKPGEPVVWEHYNDQLQRWFQLHDQAIPWDDGRYVRLEIALDITDQKDLEQSLRDSEERYRVIFEQSRDAMMIIAPPDWTFRAGNPAMVELFGAKQFAELQSLTPLDLSPALQADGRESASMAMDMLQCALQDGVYYGEWLHRRLDGREIPSTVLLTRIQLAGELMIQGTVRDISVQKRQQQALERIAHYDPLTGLPNRVLLADRMQQAMSQTLRRGTQLVIAYLDLDGFKAINDRYGHDAGDRLLVVVTERMRDTLRDSDTLARIGGDEFVAVLVDNPDTESCTPVLIRLLEAAAREVIDGGYVLKVSASLGVTSYPQEASIGADQLLRQADQAMYQAKLSGKNRIHHFDLDRDNAVRGHHEHMARLTEALGSEEFVLYYQPKVNMRTGHFIGMEALLRWQHPDRGVLPPVEFLPLIEGHSLEIALGNWVIETALAQLEQWQDKDWSVSVNVGAHQLQHPAFVQRLQSAIQRHPDVSPQRLEIEILESSALFDLERVFMIMEECLALGVTFALDDFGTGYSSLTYLKRLPVQTLKIDRSFVRDMLEDPDDHAMLEGILGLARAFRRTPVAEGVETLLQGERLLALGCELAQGYFIARPMPADAIPVWKTQWQLPECWCNHA